MNMKKFWALMLSLAMALSLAACGGDSGSSDGDAANDAEGSGDKVVRIGVFEPATGDSGPGGKQEMLAIPFQQSALLVKLTPTTFRARIAMRFTRCLARM